MVGRDGELALPWIGATLAEGLRRRAHALLLSGAPGSGLFELALSLAQGLLCEAEAGASRPCGRCASCRLVQARSHPDLLVLLPEALREALGWEAGSEDDEGGERRKPSREIKVDAVRAAIEFAQTTTARGRAKVVVVHPAERLNPIAANTLLKTLEEPPGSARFVLASGAADALLPTIRSRCERLPLPVPPAEAALAWLAAQGVREPAVLLAACGGEPLTALQWQQDGVDARLWQLLPGLVARGEATPFLNWPAARFVGALQKLCHDALCAASGSAPRYFPAGTVRKGPQLGALVAWSRELARISKDVEHPWNAGLLVEALVEDAKNALSSAPAEVPGGGGQPLHSAG